MGKIATDEVRPRYLPTGFAYRRRMDGTASSGFLDVADQVTLVHSRSTRIEDLRTPFTVHVADQPGIELSATEQRPGVSVDLGVPDAKAVYHDGWWTAPEPGSQAPIWQVGSVHSITVHTATRTYAVRAGRDVPLDELVAAIRSVLLRSSTTR
jgi:hypothetical protein